MRNYFTLGGVDSRTFGLYISGRGTFDSPTRELNTLNIPGRNGDLISGVTRLENTTVTYPAFICRNFEANMAALRAFLLSDGGYRRLIDTYHPNEYRMAAFRGPLTANVNYRNNAAQFDLTFEVKPQRFLLSGETPITVTPTSYPSQYGITNETLFSASPLIRISGKGTISFIRDIDYTRYRITIKDDLPAYFGYVDIDCETCDAYHNTTNLNQYIEVYADNNEPYGFPKLRPGDNTIYISDSNVTEYTITPRWWTV